MTKQQHHRKQSSSPLSADSIPNKGEALSSKFELTESNLRRWILGPFERQKSIVEDAHRQMIRDGVSQELAENCAHWYIKPEEKRAHDVLKLVINERTGKLWDIPTLQQAGLLSDVQIDQIIQEHKKYGNERVPPYWYIHQIHRVVDEQDKSKSYLTATCMFEGLAVGQLKDQPWVTYQGDRINHSFRLGFYHQPVLNPRTFKDADGENKRVLEFNWEINHESGNRVYEIPFEVSTFQEMLKHAYGSFEGGKISLGIISGRDKHYGVRSIEDFITDDLPVLIKSYETPPPTYKFDIDPKALADFMKYQQASEKDNQYQ